MSEKKADVKAWLLALSIILNVILAGGFGYAIGMIGEETPKDITNFFYDNRTFNYNDQQYNQSYDNYYNNQTYINQSNGNQTEQNRPPTIDYYYPLDNPSIEEGQSQSFSIVASDPDRDPVAMEWYLNGEVVQNGNSYTFIADSDSAGIYDVIVFVSDGGLTSWHEWLLTVIDVPNKPTYDLMISESICYDFGDWSTDNDCATGTAEISMNDFTKKITVNVKLNASADTTIPDSFGIGFTFRRTDEGWREDGVTVETAIIAQIGSEVENWKLENTTEAGKYYYIVNYNVDGIRAIAWTDFNDGTVVGVANGGSMGTLAPGASDTCIFTLYFSESALPDWENNQGIVVKTWSTTFVFTSEGYVVETVDLTISLKWEDLS